MTTPTLPPERLFLPCLLLLAPVLMPLLSLLDFVGPAEPPWLTLLLALLPPAGALWLVALYQREIAVVSTYIGKLSLSPGSATDPGNSEGEGIARALTAAIARMDRAATARANQLAARTMGIETLLEALPDPLILVAAQRRVRFANRAARTLLGERMGDADLALTLRHPEVTAAVDAALAGHGARTVEFSLSGPIECWYQARIKPLPQSDESAAPMVVLSLHDTTMIKRSEQQRADLVANASHELRTPLTTLIGFIETLRGPARDDHEATDRFLGIMHDQSTRMARLIDDLLSLSRIELDEHTPPTQRVDIVRCVGAAVAAFELKAAARRVMLRVTVSEPLPPVIGDPDQLAQVLQNLISNAIKYTREQTEITLTLRVDAASAPGVPALGVLTTLPGQRSRQAPQVISMAIADQGEGIARTHLPRLTERFYRVDPARSRALGGTGLGLAIVKHLLNRHRGRLTIESEVGKGSVFTVWLPVA